METYSITQARAHECSLSHSPFVPMWLKSEGQRHRHRHSLSLRGDGWPGQATALSLASGSVPYPSLCLVPSHTPPKTLLGSPSGARTTEKDPFWQQGLAGASTGADGPPLSALLPGLLHTLR